MSELTSQEIREWRNQHESQFGRSDFIDALCDLALRGLDDAEDAERYRWLRDECTYASNPDHTWILEAPAHMWDDEIDAARKEQGHE